MFQNGRVPLELQVPGEIYDERAAAIAEQCEVDQRFSQRFVWVRGGTFVLAMTLFAAAAANPDARTLGTWLGSISLAALLVAVVIQERVDRRLDLSLRQLNLFRSSAARCRRDWSPVPVPDVDVDARQLALATDLDLLGSGSLLQLVSRTYTSFGRRTVRDLLMNAAEADEIIARQEAVVELRDEFEWRTTLELLSLGIAFGHSTPMSLSQWADEVDESQKLAIKKQSANLKVIAWALPVVLWGCLIAAIALKGGVFLNIAILAAIACFLVAVWVSGGAFQTLEKIATSRGEVLVYEAMFKHVATFDAKCKWLQDSIEPLARLDGGPAAELASLGRITRLSGLRRAGFIQSILYMLAQWLLLVDLHLLSALQKWQIRNAGRVGPWFDDLGRIEAIQSLAGVAYDHPQWTMPDVAATHESIEGQQIGHPLLKEDERVSNSVTVGPPGTLLLVTGSNMSGKSTLLRSVGLNVLLGRAGGPVCAEAMTMPPLRLATSVRVHDSLADGVSFFMAELKRLKQVVDMGREEGPRLLYLLDEILQGTNSAERQIAVSHVLQHLRSAGAIGAISTHDLELASLPELEPHCETVHFRETLGSDGSAQSMTFDYQLRQGVATTTNALKLLELVGLTDLDDVESE